MNGLTLMLIALVVLGAGYMFYGRYLEKKWGIDPNLKTPAYELEDGIDYVPTDKGLVFGHQFASIAGAGPINGPIQAAMFGWVPVLLWILLGGVFFGAMQDFVSMYASVKNKGRTIGYIIERYIGNVGKKLFLSFTWLFSTLTIAAFADVVAKTFDGFNTSVDGTMSLSLDGGQVASTSMIFIVVAVALGLILKYGKLKKWMNTVIAIVFLIGCMVLGMNAPIYLTTDSWHLIVFVYIAIASVVPIWLLLQPRDYLNSYLFVVMIVLSIAGVLLYNPQMNLKAFNGFTVAGQTLFPYLFVTIACGAVSGFHSLVSSGTASKQIKNEKDMLPISFGSMLLESMLAVIALIAVGFVATGGVIPSDMTQPQIFASACATFMSKFGIPEPVCETLITLAVSAFALTSLDSVARVGRLSFQELFLDSSVEDENMSPLLKILTNKYVATVVTLAVAFALTKIGYASIWPLFGSANQLLSALALIACSVFLKKTNRKGWMLWVPMSIMLGVTFTALIMTVIRKVGVLVTATSGNVIGDVLQLGFALVLVILGVIVAIQGLQKLMEKKSTTVEEAK